MPGLFGTVRPIEQSDHDWLLSHPALLDPEVRLQEVKLRLGGVWTWYLRRNGRNGITFGNSIWFAEEAGLRRRPLLAHELVHVAQYRRHGMAGFLLRYGWQLVRNGGYSRDLRLEVPAYARAALARTRPNADST